MIKSELDRVLKSTKGRVALILILIMPIIDLLMHIYGEIIVYGGFESYQFFHPTYASFLSGSSVGHFTQILFFWMLPLYFLILYSDSYTTDMKSGYYTSLISRIGKREYFKTKFKIAFLLPFIIMFLSLTLNLIISFLLFHSGYSLGGLEYYYETMNRWFQFGYRNPYLYYFIYIITDSLICALASVLGLCCSILFKNHFKAYPAAFFIWLAQIILPFGIGNTLQPFTEYGLSYFMSGLSIFIACVAIMFGITYFLRIKKDEII